MSPGEFAPKFGRPVGADGAVQTSPADSPAPVYPSDAGPRPPMSAPSPSSAEKMAVGVGVGVLVLMFLGRLLNPVRLLFVAIGVGVIFLGHYLEHRRDTFQARAIHASGRVVRLDQGGSGGDLYYYPVVDFVTREGAPTQFRDTQGSRPPSNHVGDTVEIYYNPLAPTDAQIDSPVSRWLPIGMYVCGALVVLAAIVGNVARNGGDSDLMGSF
ncbi:hypothetical protein CCAX7_20170 [Capsulimonas corticalis]|uniref:DUF3592 domain-containing protein n=2 Tax=Capsulimonas corticalis TaxID=2219043 RepID=A0A9N7QD83_9BACT|nr:hypothetical protein CCAX7_20170 [Capsulimonas corticalis]